MGNLVVHDPTGFWDNVDMTALTQEHTRMQALIDLFQESDLVQDLLRLVGIADLAIPHPRAPWRRAELRERSCGGRDDAHTKKGRGH